MQITSSSDIYRTMLFCLTTSKGQLDYCLQKPQTCAIFWLHSLNKDQMTFGKYFAKQ